MTWQEFAEHSHDEGNPKESRVGRELIHATRPFCGENPVRSWWSLGSTLVVLTGVLSVALFVEFLPVRVIASILSGLVMVRVFVIYHDYMHGSILRRSRLARIFFQAFGIAVLTPPRIWRKSHNFHHSHTAKLHAPSHGSFPLMTVEAWQSATRGERLKYRISRHPITIAIGYATVFAFEMTLLPFLSSARRNWDAGVSLLTHSMIMVGLYLLAGGWGLFYGWILPEIFGSAVGAYLFYAQHNFEGASIRTKEDWNHTSASLEASSYIKLGPIMRWFTANIGYHHIHHLNPRIPFYRLPEVMASIPEFQSPRITTLGLREIRRCFRLKLWKPEEQRMVSFAEARVQPTPT